MTVEPVEQVELAGGEVLWRLTVEHSPVGTTLVAPDGRLLSANRALCEMLGYSEEDIRGRTFQQITHPDDLADDLALLEETLAGQRSSYRLRKRYLHADGRVVHCDLSVALIRDADGTPQHFISQILDVTDQVLYAEQLSATSTELDRQRQYLEAILDSIDVGVAVHAAGGYVVTNRRHREYVELAHPTGAQTKMGQPGDLFTPSGRRLETHELPSQRAAAGEHFDDLIVEVGADQASRRALSVSSRPIRGPEGEQLGAVLAYSDVTDLVRALAAKDHFVAAVSHELRTPLTSVLGNLELVRDFEGLSPQLVERLDVMERNAERLRELVADLLTVAQLTDGRVRLSRSEVDVGALVVEAADAVRAAAEAAGLDLAVDVPPAPLVAEVDGPRLRQVIDNLVGNAVKYTERGGSVAVRLTATYETLSLAVVDTGIGVDPDEAGRLFHRFFRGADAASRHIPGVGLGLSIVRSIVDAHGGRVSVVGRPGEGSTFTVELPLAP